MQLATFHYSHFGPVINWPSFYLTEFFLFVNFKTANLQTGLLWLQRMVGESQSNEDSRPYYLKLPNFFAFSLDYYQLSFSWSFSRSFPCRPDSWFWHGSHFGPTTDNYLLMPIQHGVGLGMMMMMKNNTVTIIGSLFSWHNLENVE